MTSGAGARQDIAVVYLGWRPCCRFMAGIARSYSRSVTGVLALGGGAVMTSGAGARQDITVVYLGGRPTAGTVTGIAARGRWNMVCRLGGCTHPVA